MDPRGGKCSPVEKDSGKKDSRARTCQKRSCHNLPTLFSHGMIVIWASILAIIPTGWTPPSLLKETPHYTLTQLSVRDIYVELEVDKGGKKGCFVKKPLTTCLAVKRWQESCPRVVISHLRKKKITNELFFFLLHGKNCGKYRVTSYHQICGFIVGGDPLHISKTRKRIWSVGNPPAGVKCPFIFGTEKYRDERWTPLFPANIWGYQSVRYNRLIPALASRKEVLQILWAVFPPIHSFTRGQHASNTSANTVHTNVCVTALAKIWQKQRGFAKDYRYEFVSTKVRVGTGQYFK
jgi:hypothetical protein